MASGGSASGSGFFKKKVGLLTPKLRKKQSTAAKVKENGVEKNDGKDLLADSNLCSVETGSSSIVHVPQGAGTSKIDDCHGNAFSNDSRLSTSTENVGQNISKASVKRKSKTLTLRRKKAESNKTNSKQGSKLWTFRIKKSGCNILVCI